MKKYFCLFSLLAVTGCFQRTKDKELVCIEKFQKHEIVRPKLIDGEQHIDNRKVLKHNKDIKINVLEGGGGTHFGNGSKFIIPKPKC